MSATGLQLRRWCRWAGVQVCLVTLVCLSSAQTRAQEASTQAPDWQQITRKQAREGKLDAALQAIEERLVIHPDDLEAHAWRGRVLAWKGRWSDAENEYRLVLQHAPNDLDVLSALADVLLWQEKPQAALEIVERTRVRAPLNEEVLLRRARILQILGRTHDAREQLREILRLNRKNKEARSSLSALSTEYKHELRFGNDVDTYNYTDTAQTQSIFLHSHWSRRWSSLFGTGIYERFGQQAQKFSGSTTVRISTKDWLGIGGAAANDHGIVPRAEASFEYGHGFRFQNHSIRGLEVSYQQRWLWYRGAHVLTLAAAQTYYLPRDLAWSLTVTGARSGFTNTGIEWVPSGSTRLRFPLQQRLSGNLSFGVGSESYAQVDQIGRFSARIFAGGLQFRCAPNQDLSGYVARQNRSQDRSQTSYGLSYGIRF